VDALTKFSIGLALAACTAVSAQSVPADWPLYGHDKVDPCAPPPGVQFGVIGPVTIAYRSGHEFLPAQVVPSNLKNLTRYKSRAGTAGNYHVEALVKHNICENVLQKHALASTRAYNASGGRVWEGAFCDSVDCVCAPTELRWRTRAKAIVAASINFDFGNCLQVDGGGSATVSALVQFSVGGSAEIAFSASGGQATDNVTLTPIEDGQPGEPIEVELNLDRWDGEWQIPVDDISRGWTRGCGFIGEIFEVTSTAVASATVSEGANLSKAQATTFIDDLAGLYVMPFAGQDGCMNPINPHEGRGAGVRILNDGTPVTDFLEMLASVELPCSQKIELLLAMECRGPEIDYYLRLISEADVQEFFSMADPYALGFPAMDLGDPE